MSLVGPIVSVSLATITVIFYTVSVSTDYWLIMKDYHHDNFGLWRQCDSFDHPKCKGLDRDYRKGYVIGTRTLMMLAVIAAFITWLIALLAVFLKWRKTECDSPCGRVANILLTINGILFSVTGILVLAAMAWYTAETVREYREEFFKYSFGYSAIIGWVSFPLGIISGLLMAFFFYRMSFQVYYVDDDDSDL
ncbi:epithelial membrane protein 2-like [Ptychodera flava]|uniref:epithelial membrane protein 2-like n=1 Tax=Ptychodera flava TaxID=63121 RepID=UPI00396A2E2F